MGVKKKRYAWMSLAYRFLYINRLLSIMRGRIKQAQAQLEKLDLLYYRFCNLLS